MQVPAQHIPTQEGNRDSALEEGTQEKAALWPHLGFAKRNQKTEFLSEISRFLDLRNSFALTACPKLNPPRSRIQLINSALRI